MLDNSRKQNTVTDSKKESYQEYSEPPRIENSWRAMVQRDWRKALNEAWAIRIPFTSITLLESPDLSGIFEAVIEGPRDSIYDFFEPLFNNNIREESWRNVLLRVFRTTSVERAEIIIKSLFEGKPYRGQTLAFKALMDVNPKPFIKLFQSQLNKGEQAETIKAFNFMMAYPQFLLDKYSDIHLSKQGFLSLIDTYSRLKTLQLENRKKIEQHKGKPIPENSAKDMRMIDQLLVNKAKTLFTIFENSISLFNFWNPGINQEDEKFIFSLCIRNGVCLDFIKKLCTSSDQRKVQCHELLQQLLTQQPDQFKPGTPLWCTTRMMSDVFFAKVKDKNVRFRRYQEQLGLQNRHSLFSEKKFSEEKKEVKRISQPEKKVEYKQLSPAQKARKEKQFPQAIQLQILEKKAQCDNTLHALRQELSQINKEDKYSNRQQLFMVWKINQLELIDNVQKMQDFTKKEEQTSSFGFSVQQSGKIELFKNALELNLSNYMIQHIALAQNLVKAKLDFTTRLSVGGTAFIVSQFLPIPLVGTATSESLSWVIQRQRRSESHERAFGIHSISKAGLLVTDLVEKLTCSYQLLISRLHPLAIDAFAESLVKRISEFEATPDLIDSGNLADHLVMYCSLHKTVNDSMINPTEDSQLIAFHPLPPLSNKESKYEENKLYQYETVDTICHQSAMIFLGADDKYHRCKSLGEMARVDLPPRCISNYEKTYRELDDSEEWKGNLPSPPLFSLQHQKLQFELKVTQELKSTQKELRQTKIELHETQARLQEKDGLKEEKQYDKPSIVATKSIRFQYNNSHSIRSDNPLIETRTIRSATL